MSTLTPSTEPSLEPALPPSITPADAHALRRGLEQRAEALRGELVEARAHDPSGRRGEGLGGREVGDLEDAAGEAAIETVADAEMQRDLDELRQVEAALLRMAEGFYGQCADCGEPIELPRLQAQPAALRCMACQRRAESALRLRAA